MGMSASQSRMLFLTSRISDLELRAQQLTNTKIRLATQQTQASNEYLAALSTRNVISNGVEVSAATLNSGDSYRIVDSSGNIIISDADKNVLYAGISRAEHNPNGRYFNDVWDGLVTAFATKYSNIDFSTGDVTKGLQKYINRNETAGKSSEIAYDVAAYAIEQGVPEAEARSLEATYHSIINQQSPDMYATKDALQKAKDKQGLRDLYATIDPNSGYAVVSDTMLSDSKVLQQKLSTGEWKLVQVTDKTGNIEKTTSQLGFTEEYDDNYIEQKKVAYDIKMQRIQSEEQIYDMELKNIDTEHKATETEMDSVKSVVQKNVERTFKIFG